MLLEFFLELIWGGPDLSKELLHLKTNPLWNFRVCLKLCSVIDFKFIEKFYGIFCRSQRGGTELLTEQLDF